MCSFDKVPNQQVDWVAWASIRICDAIDDACTTSSDLELKTGKNLLFLDCVYAPACTTERTRSLGKANVGCARHPQSRLT